MYGSTTVNSSVSSFRKADCFVGAASVENKNAVRQNSPDTNDFWEKLRKFDSFEADASDSGKNISRYTRPANQAADKNRTNHAEKNSGAEKKTVCLINGEELDDKKARELQEAYAYFRRAASSNGYSVVRSSADDGFSYCISSGKKSVIMIDPEFMNSIRDNPEALKKYADEIENMKRLDKQFERQAKQQGKTVVSRGWRIEKDGSISSWSVTKTVRKATKGQLERMNELRNKILKKKTKKKKEEAALQEKRSRRKEEQLRLEGRRKAAAKENIKRKIKKVRIYDLTRLTPKKYPGSGKTVSVSVSCGRSPSLLAGNNGSGK
ncbi:MAG: DUF6033 family protein [Firmicutes bacterium]|nr:DUF6033 family protein [[Eubacterium] siraeum]MCM1488199.1 DUF6033 family protein [Bacillota bacterium]